MKLKGSHQVIVSLEYKGKQSPFFTTKLNFILKSYKLIPSAEIVNDDKHYSIVPFKICFSAYTVVLVLLFYGYVDLCKVGQP